MNDIKAPFPSLPVSYKKRFPFRLSVPSFIYPAGYVKNVRYIGPFVDEIELLLFESRKESLPSAADVRELASLAMHCDISYNVHLPLDLYLAATDPRLRAEAVVRLIEIVELIGPLSPTSHTLHLVLPRKHPDQTELRAWQWRAMQSLKDVLCATRMEPRRLSIETIDYPPEWFFPLVQGLDLSVCVDIGHVLRYGFDLQKVLAQFDRRIDVMHLHGVADGLDHLSLERLAPQARAIVRSFLEHFRGAVSLEVFDFERLRSSLTELTAMMAAAQPPAMAGNGGPEEVVQRK